MQKKKKNLALLIFELLKIDCILIENALLVSNIVLISHPSFHHLRPINKVQTSYKCWNIYDDQPVNKIKHIYNPFLRNQ